MAAADRARDLWTAAEAVDNAVANARKRLQRRSPGWWRGAARSGRPRADVVAEAVATLAAHDPTAPAAPTRPPRDETLTDQLTVVAHDLAIAMRDGADLPAGDVEDVIATCLRDVDPRE